MQAQAFQQDQRACRCLFAYNLLDVSEAWDPMRIQDILRFIFLYAIRSSCRRSFSDVKYGDTATYRLQRQQLQVDGEWSDVFQKALESICSQPREFVGCCHALTHERPVSLTQASQQAFRHRHTFVGHVAQLQLCCHVKTLLAA